MPNIVPEKIFLDIFGGIYISETVLTAYCVTIVLIVFALIVRFVALPRFKDIPRGLQNILELAVAGINKFSNGIMGKRGATIAGYMFCIAFFLIISGLAELLGVRAPGTDLNFTLAVSLISFVLICSYGIKAKGVKGWAKSYTKPVAVVTPFKIISDCVLPVSMACRMFGNLFSGLIVMHLIYEGLGYFAATGLPGLASLYFTVFHVGMQTYVFLMLSLSFIQEKVE